MLNLDCSQEIVTNPLDFSIPFDVMLISDHKNLKAVLNEIVDKVKPILGTKYRRDKNVKGGQKRTQVRLLK